MKLDNFPIFKNYYKFFINVIFIFGFVLSLYVLFFNLGRFPFENWDEAFYAQATKELLQTRDIIVLHWNYGVWLDKPPMYIWISAIVSSLIGLSELSVRLPSAISALAIIVFVSFYAYKKYSLLPALFTFFTLLLNNVFIWRARGGNLDLLASLLILLTYFLLISKNKYKYVLLGLVFALIYLTKASLVAFPFIIFILSELFYQRKEIRQHVKDYIKLLAIFIGISGSWLLLGYLKAGTEFISYYLFQSDQGVATVSEFNSTYLGYAYYSLQRRFFWLFLIGSAFALLNIRKQRYFLLLMFSWLLLLQLSFTHRDNNWYIIPSMAFWSLTIGFGVYSILKVLKRKKILYFLAVAFLIIVSTYIFSKTFFVNILPILTSSSTVEQAQSAKQISKLSKPNEVVVRLDPLIPTTLYYDNRRTFAYSPEAASNSYWINKKDLAVAISEKKIKWLVGKSNDVEFFLKDYDAMKFKKIKVNDQETILEVK